MSDGGVAHFEAEFDRRRATLAGKDLSWLDGARASALKQFSTLGFPTQRHEDWKYTRVAAIESRAFVTEVTPGAVDAATLDALVGDAKARHRVVFVDGCYQPDLSTKDQPDGARILSLREALEGDDEQLSSMLTRHAGNSEHAFSALNTAFMDDGVVIALGARCKLDAPIELVFLTTAQADGVAMHPRIAVFADAESEASIIENYASANAQNTYFNNVVTDIVLRDNASLAHFKLQREATKAFHIAALNVHQGRDSRFASHSLSFGGQITRNDIRIDLDAPGAECVLNGLFLANGRQHVDFHTWVEHLKPHCTSAETYKGILGGRSRGVFNGAVRVHPDAQKSDASQASNNLLLSKDAEIDTKPQLEIYADDVKCAHGATVGQLDENMVFYLRTRGLDETLARGLLTFGFAQDIVERLPDAEFREQASAALLNHLPGAENIAPVLSEPSS